MVTIPCPSLENTSEDSQSNRPYPSFGIWLYHFNFEILMHRKAHFDSFLAHLCELLPSLGVHRPTVSFFKNLPL